MILVVSESAPRLVNPIPAEELPAWIRAMSSTFLGDPGGPQTARRIELLTREWEPERAWGIRDNGRWVATLRTEPRLMSVPGLGADNHDLTVDALTNVTVSATHRRRGLMRQMLDGSLRAAADRGAPASILIAAEWPIYGRFGYSPATLSADYVLHRRRLGASAFGDPTRVRQVEREEFGECAASVYELARRSRAGQLDRSAVWWDRVLGRNGYPPSEELPHNWFIHSGEDGPDGLLAWKASGNFSLIPPFGAVSVWELASAGATAYRDLWAYVSGIDAVEHVNLSGRPVDEPVRWLLDDARALVMTQHVDFVWVRLLDVPAALGARRYAVPGEVVLEVIDADGDRFAAGRYRLSADGEEVSCTRVTAPADVQITQRALSSIYLGGFRLRELLISGAAQELTSGAVALVDLMFSTPLPPWNATWF